MNVTSPTTSPPPRALRERAVTWLRLFRPHHAPLTLTAGIAGMTVAPDNPTTASLVVGALICFGGYPMGQVFNDYADREADAINAPHRPFVTGEINPIVALSVVAAITVTALVAAAIVAPGVLVWTAVAIVGNATYSLVKGLPMVGNVANGIDLAFFVLIGAAAAAPERSPFDVPSEVVVCAVLVAVMLSAFCLLSYFKDITGDRAAGYRTLPVVLDGRGARFWTIPIPLAGFAAAAAIAVADPSILGADGSNVAFWALLVLAAGAFAMSIAQVFTPDPEAKGKEALVWSVRGAVLYALALAALPEPELILALTIPIVAFMEIAYFDTRHERQA